MAIYINGKYVASVHQSIIDPVIVHETGDSVANVMSQAGSTNSFANALKGKAIGSCVSIDDLTPFEAKVKTVVKSKNLCPISDKTTSGTNSWTASIFNPITLDRGKVYTVSADFAQTGTDSSMVQLAIRKASNVNAHIASTQHDGKNGKLWVSFTVPNDETGVIIVLYSNLSANALNTSCTFSNIQLEEGSTATAYTPYIADGTAVTVKSCGKNIFNIQDSDSEEDSGDCYTYNYWLKPNTKYTVSSNAPNTIPTNIYANGGSTNVNGVSVGAPRTVITDSNGYMYISVRFKPASNGGIDLYSRLLDGTYYLQIEEGEVATAYEPYIEGETISTAFGEKVELAPITPHMTIATDRSSAVVHAEYNKDTNKVIEELAKNGGGNNGGNGGTSPDLSGYAKHEYVDTKIEQLRAELTEEINGVEEELHMINEGGVE